MFGICRARREAHVQKRWVNFVQGKKYTFLYNINIYHSQKKKKKKKEEEEKEEEEAYILSRLVLLLLPEAKEMIH